MNIDLSRRMFEKARKIIPGGTQTISKRPSKLVPQDWPAYCDHAEGAELRDVDNNTFIDFVQALGPIILGYNNRWVNDAIEQQLRKGILTSLQSPLEIDVAELLVMHIPCAEMVRFFKTGAEATAAAVRVARAYTGREHVVSVGYAGWHDWWVAKLSPDQSSAGVPKSLGHLVHDAPLQDIERLEAIVSDFGADIACVVVEPKGLAGEQAYLKRIRDLCDQIGCVLVFDEIVTGFRMSIGGAQAVYGVTPDLTTLGKALANGMPLAALVGQREIMQHIELLWITSTFGGEALSLAAAKATITELEKPGTMAHLHNLGRSLQDGWRNNGADNGVVSVYGDPSMPGIRFADPLQHTEFSRHMLYAGFLTRPNHCFFLTLAHTEEQIQRTVDASAEALNQVLSLST